MQNNGIRILSGVGSAILLLLSIGCQSNSQPDGRSQGRVLDDKEITKRVERSLKDEPAYKFESVTVNTFAGIVQLSGFVNTEAQKDRAQQLAQNVGGVKEVVNGITLKPVPQPAGRPKVQRIYSEPETSTSSAPASKTVVAQPDQTVIVQPAQPAQSAPSAPANPPQKNGTDQEDKDQK